MPEKKYDVEKVVEQLKDAAYTMRLTSNDDGFYNDDSYEVISLKKAIRIVRGGGDYE